MDEFPRHDPRRRGTRVSDLRADRDRVEDVGLTRGEADKAGEFQPRTSREELHRMFIFFTPLERFAHAATSDRELYYLRTAQGWFFLALGASGALVLAIGSPELTIGVASFALSRPGNRRKGARCPEHPER